MTRRSKREVEHALESIDAGDADDVPQAITVRREVVDKSGDVITTVTREIDAGGSA